MKRAHLQLFPDNGRTMHVASWARRRRETRALHELLTAHPDLSGSLDWPAGSVCRAPDPLTQNLASPRDGTLLNFERDNAMIRRSDPNKPLYKPEFWEKVQKFDQNGNTEDPSFGCKPAGVPRMGPPAQIVQTPKLMVFLYVSPAAEGWGDAYRVIMTDGRAHTPLDDLDGTWKGESIGH